MTSRRSHELTIDELREILHLPNHLIAIIKPDGTFYKVNEEANPVLGWEPEEVIGQKVKDFVHPEDWEETYAQMVSVFVGARAVVEDMRNRVRRKDGSWRWVSWTGKAKGGLIYAHGSDITEKVEYEEALTVQSLVLESINEGVVILNEKGSIVFANTAAERLYGYDTEELLGKKVYTLSGATEDEARASIRDIVATVSSESIWKGELLSIRQDGTRFVSACSVTILDLHGEKHYVCVQRDISLKKKLSKEREELETRFRTFFEQSALPMIIFDLQGDPLDVNSAWEILYDTPRSSLIGYNLLKDPTTEAAGLTPYLKKAFAGEVVNVPPFHIDPANVEGGRKGRARWLEAWFSPIRNPDGSPRELAVILKDVTEQFETQKVLEDLQLRYRVASESLSLAVKVGKVGIWEWYPQDNRVVWDETTELIYGYEKGGFNQTSDAYTSHLHPEDVQRCWAIVSLALEQARAYNMDHRIIRKDGEVRWLQGSGMPFYNEKKEVIRVLGTTIDITERKEQEEDQKFISDISEILSSSFSFEENIQKVLDLAAPKYFESAAVERINDNHTSQLIAASGIVSENRDTVILNGKNGPIGTFSFSIKDSNSRRSAERMKLIAREIGLRITLAIENSLLFHHSQEAIRARDEFLSIASHELKTPLQSLTLQNQMRKRMLEKNIFDATDNASLMRSFDMDKRQLTRINRLIDDMLDISRIRNSKLSIHKESINVISLLDDVLERLHHQFEAAGCVLKKEYSGLLEVSADSYRLEQVFVNILINAMKYGAGSPVTVKVRKTEKNAIIEIQDEGPGIRAEDCERIFHRFERAVSSREVSGMGLGLYISREIMELHEGAVYATSDLGRGSTFTVELPL